MFWNGTNERIFRWSNSKSWEFPWFHLHPTFQVTLLFQESCVVLLDMYLSIVYCVCLKETNCSPPKKKICLASSCSTSQLLGRQLSFSELSFFASQGFSFFGAAVSWRDLKKTHQLRRRNGLSGFPPQKSGGFTVLAMDDSWGSDSFNDESLKFIDVLERLPSKQNHDHLFDSHHIIHVDSLLVPAPRFFQKLSRRYQQKQFPRKTWWNLLISDVCSQKICD